MWASICLVASMLKGSLGGTKGLFNLALDTFALSFLALMGFKNMCLKYRFLYCFLRMLCFPHSWDLKLVSE